MLQNERMNLIKGKKNQASQKKHSKQQGMKEIIDTLSS